MQKPAPAPILVIAASRGLVSMLRAALDENRYTIEIAATPKEALRRILRAPLAAVVSVYDLPKMNGLELLSFCARRQPDSLRILLADDRPAGIVEALSTGTVERLFVQPWPSGTLIECLRHKLRHAETLDRHNPFHDHLLPQTAPAA